MTDRDKHKQDYIRKRLGYEGMTDSEIAELTNEFKIKYIKAMSGDFSIEYLKKVLLNDPDVWGEHLRKERNKKINKILNGIKYNK